MNIVKEEKTNPCKPANMPNTFNIYSEFSNVLQDIINSLQNGNKKIVVNYIILRCHIKKSPSMKMTFGTINRSKYGVRKIEAMSSSNIIPVYCTIHRNT
jgi:hypothetical protein